MSGITVIKADPGDMPELLEIRREMLAIVNGVPVTASVVVIKNLPEYSENVFISNRSILLGISRKTN